MIGRAARLSGKVEGCIPIRAGNKARLRYSPGMRLPSKIDLHLSLDDCCSIIDSMQ